MKKLTLHLLSIIAVCSMLVSCLKNDPVTSTTISGYFTIEGTYPNYTLYMDGGGIIYPTPESVSSITKGKGFGNIHRAGMAIRYDFDQVTEPQPGQKGEPIVKNARIEAYQELFERSILSTEAAQEKNILAADSLFDVVKATKLWYYHNYLNFEVSGFISADQNTRTEIMPSLNLVCHSDSISANRLAFNACYNQHSKKDDWSHFGPYTLHTSYNITNLLRQTPGNDSINVVLHYTVNSKTLSASIKCPRPGYATPTY